jgi:tripartite-type tricarboxylate transporter receptor subunit TctC/cytochrome c551/c552
MLLFRRCHALGWLIWLVALAGCGAGGSTDEPSGATASQAPTTAAPAAPPPAAATNPAAPDDTNRERALTLLRARAQVLVAQRVTPSSAAAELMDFAQAQFPSYFPGRPVTQSLPPFAFRHYPEAGTYLGVVVTPDMGYGYLGVYVMGGAFGTEPLFVGPLAQFITPGAEPAVRIDQQPDDRVAGVGDSVEFSVIAAGKLPLTYQWYREGSAIPSAVGDRLRLSPVSTDQRGYYSVEVRDADGRTTMSNRVALIVRETGVPAAVADILRRSNCAACHTTSQRLVGPSWTEVSQRYLNQTTQEAYLAQRIRGGGQGSWGAVPMPASNLALADAQTVARWLIAGIGNPGGTAAPVLAALPATSTADLGTTLRLQADAQGSPPLSYQWRRNGVDIDGATNAVLDVGPLDMTDHETTYTVQVRNAAGSVRSSTVVRVVDPVAFPSGPVTLVVPAAVGSIPDNLARSLADTLRDRSRWTSVTVLNVPASGGLAALDRVLSSPANGYTLLLADARLAGAPALYPSRALDLTRDLEPLGVLTRLPLVLLGGNHQPAGGAAELLAHWRARGASALFAHLGTGDVSQRCALVLADTLGLPVTLKAYSGSAPLSVDLIDSKTDLACLVAPSLNAQVQRNQVRAYAVTGGERSNLPALAAVQTLDENGLPGLELSDWHGLYVRRGTSVLVMQRIQQAMAEARESAIFQSQAVQRGLHLALPPLATPEGHRAHVEAEIDRWRALAQRHGLKAE